MARLIKRYENRKLYDTEASAYVSLAEVARLVRRGETVEVLDNVTGKDLTAQILTQIILEEGKRGHHTISTEVLHDLVRRSNEMLDTGIDQIRHGVDDLVQHSLQRVQRLFQSTRPGELAQLRDQLGHLERLLTRMLAAGTQDEAADDPATPPADS